MDTPIPITAEPIDTNRCRFVIGGGVVLAPGTTRRFTSRDDAMGSPLVENIFTIPGAGIREVVVSGSSVTVVKESAAPWQAVGKTVGGAIRLALAGAQPPLTPKADTPVAAGPVDDDVLYERVARLFDEQVNPMVARHGGRVELIDVQDAVVLLRLGGGCQGCGMADVTLRQGIEGMLSQFIPEVKGVEDITDHASGSNPYFAAAKK
jgi:Fe-S cluster biogenesis protein NfuA